MQYSTDWVECKPILKKEGPLPIVSGAALVPNVLNVLPLAAELLVTPEEQAVDGDTERLLAACGFRFHEGNRGVRKLVEASGHVLTGEVGGAAPAAFGLFDLLGHDWILQ